MKAFRSRLGHVAGETITVGELRELLLSYPDDMPIFAEWEGCDAYIDKDNFNIETVSKGNDDDKCECIVIDVNRY